MKPPRFLAVPFELGRPFGAPNQPEFQTRVLRAALKLLESEADPPVLEIFPEDAPEEAGETETAWSCPVSFAPKPGMETERAGLALAEIEQLKPWVEVYAQKQGKSARFVSGLDLNQIVRLLDELAGGNPAPETGSEMPLHELIRLSIDDVRAWYGEAAQGQPGKKTFQEINHWFWTETATALLIAGAALALTDHAVRTDDGFLRVFCDKLMVQRQFKEHLFAALEKSK
jgi:hypothetical protein